MIKFDNIDIVMVGTLKSGNVGSAARAMKNMGFSILKLVHPKCRIDDEAFRMATHGAAILKNVQIFSTLREAINKSSCVFGTTARDRRCRSIVYPDRMAENISKLGRKNKISIIFGPEDAGLSNDELELCSEVVSIPTTEDATSINISHSILIICYEIFCAAVKNRKTEETAEFATNEERENMYDHMRSTLLDIGFLNPQNPEIFLGKFRRILSRAGLTGNDVNLIRGVFRQLRWYINKTKQNKS